MLPCKYGRFSSLSVRSPCPDAFSREDAGKGSSVVGKTEEYIGMWKGVLPEGGTGQSLSVLSLHSVFSTRYPGQNNPILPEVPFAEHLEA